MRARQNIGGADRLSGNSVVALIQLRPADLGAQTTLAMHSLVAKFSP